MQPYNRFTMTADVIVPTMKDATNVLESCQRSRMGKKRILVTLTQSSDIRYPYYFIFAYFLYFVRRMNTFRANISFLMKDGYSMSLSDLQVGFIILINLLLKFNFISFELKISNPHSSSSTMKILTTRIFAASKTCEYWALRLLGFKSGIKGRVLK